MLCIDDLSKCVLELQVYYWEPFHLILFNSVVLYIHEQGQDVRNTSEYNAFQYSAITNYNLSAET